MGLFLPRQSILVPIGLVTQPNQYAQYPSGAGKVVRNLVMRNPGELVQAPDVQGVTGVGNVNDVLQKLIPLDSGHVYTLHQNGSTWTVREANLGAFGPTADAFSSTGRISWTRAAERLVLNCEFDTLIGDFMAPTTVAERQLRSAGLPQPTFTGANPTEPGVGWLSAGQMVGYCFCFTRELSNGYVLRSTPSVAWKVFLNSTHTTPPYNVSVGVKWSGGNILAGDKVEVYRTDILNTDSANADPGATFKRVLSHTVTSAEQAGGSTSGIVDRQPPFQGTPVTPGEELYTNPGQEGELYANRRPPIAKCIDSFKGFAFYDYTTERAQWRFAVPGGFGAQNEAVDAGVSVETHKLSGIGTRTITGTVTIGSPTVTGISAADMVGLVTGQQITGTGFPAGATIIAVGATTITFGVNANAAPASISVMDVLELNGVKTGIFDAYNWLVSIGAAWEVVCSITIPVLSPRYILAFEMSLEPNNSPFNSSITVRGTNGQNYSPPIPLIAATVATFTPTTIRNRFQWSKEQQPEHCPSVSEGFAGFGEVYATVSTRDAHWKWCSDGLFRLSGDAGALGLGNWQIDFANSTLIIAGPQAVCALNEFQYAYTNVGFVEVDSAGTVVNLTDKIIGDLLPGQKYTETRKIVVARNETDEEVVLILGDNGSDSSDTVYVFNTKQRSWTTLGSNGANLSKITAMEMQRSPSSGEPRLLFGVTPLGGVAPSYSGWNSPSAFLAYQCRYQPIYGDDPLELKRWLWADYLFDTSSNGKLITPEWNGIAFGGSVAIETLDQGGYARAGCPREVGLSQSISAGFSGPSGATQMRFQGLSVPVKQRTNQSKKR